MGNKIILQELEIRFNDGGKLYIKGYVLAENDNYVYIEEKRTKDKYKIFMNNLLYIRAVKGNWLELKCLMIKK